jgi:hypothetical protein
MRFLRFKSKRSLVSPPPTQAALRLDLPTLGEIKHYAALAT